VRKIAEGSSVGLRADWMPPKLLLSVRMENGKLGLFLVCPGRRENLGRRGEEALPVLDRRGEGARELGGEFDMRPEVKREEYWSSMARWLIVVS